MNKELIKNFGEELRISPDVLVKELSAEGTAKTIADLKPERNVFLSVEELNAKIAESGKNFKDEGYKHASEVEIKKILRELGLQDSPKSAKEAAEILRSFFNKDKETQISELQKILESKTSEYEKMISDEKNKFESFKSNSYIDSIVNEIEIPVPTEIQNSGEKAIEDYKTKVRNRNKILFKNFAIPKEVENGTLKFFDVSGNEIVSETMKALNKEQVKQKFISDFQIQTSVKSAQNSIDLSANKTVAIEPDLLKFTENLQKSGLSIESPEYKTAMQDWLKAQKK